MKTWKPKDIKRLRTHMELSQTAFAEKIGVTMNYVHLLEKGVKTPSKTLRLLLDCTNEKEIDKEKK
jgi:DNA-binding transcriptional regulator YiaG